MKAETHPSYKEVNVICSCGNKFKTRSTIGKPEIHIEVCSVCHPYYTGKQKLMDTGGRIDKFKKRYAAPAKKAGKPEATA
jgi:large subunit ribosomal protein L31